MATCGDFRLNTRWATDFQRPVRRAEHLGDIAKPVCRDEAALWR